MSLLTLHLSLTFLFLDAARTESSQLWGSAQDNSPDLDHLRDDLSGSVLALACTSFAFVAGFDRLMLVFPARRDPGVDLAAALVMVPCC